VAFYAMGRLSGGLGPWESFISGVLLIAAAVGNPEGIAGAVRTARTKATRRTGAVT
jgi:hypothetical protein